MHMMDTVRIGTAAESPLQASKWLQCQALLSGEEMRALFASLEPFTLFIAGSITEPGKGILSKQHFLALYESYIGMLRSGQVPQAADYRPYFSAVMSADDEALYKLLIDAERQLIRIAKPVVQLQAHHLDYSPLDGKFRSMVFGSDSITWGLQFSYPQLFQEAASKQILQTRQQRAYVNTQLFQRLQQWMRQHTSPSPFLVNGKVVNVPARLGKECFAWINSHPQLKSKGLCIAPKPSPHRHHPEE